MHETIAMASAQAKLNGKRLATVAFLDEPQTARTSLPRYVRPQNWMHESFWKFEALPVS
jgi:hypothetical protein